MNNQFATQFLLEDQDEVNASIENVISQTGADKDLVDFIMNAIRQGVLTPEKAIQIIRDTFKGMHEDGAAAPAGGSTTGGGVTNGASFTPGNGEQYAMGTKKVRKTLGETTVGQHFDLDVKSERGDGSVQRYQLKNVKLVNSNERVFEKPDGTTVVLSPSDKYTATKVGDLDEDAPRLAGEPSKTNSQGSKNLNAYSSVGFTKAPNAEEAGKQMKGIDVDMLWKEALEESRAYNQFKKEAAMRSKPDQLHQAAKMIQHKLDEVTKLLEFTSQMRNELSEGEANVEYRHNTKKVFERIHSKVVEVYTKVKGLK